MGKVVWLDLTAVSPRVPCLGHPFLSFVLTFSLPPLLKFSLSLELIGNASRRAEHSVVTHSQHLDQSRVSAVVAIHYKKKLPSPRSSPELWVCTPTHVSKAV